MSGTRQVIDLESKQSKKSKKLKNKGQPLKFEQAKVVCKKPREIPSVPGGVFDDMGFYNLPDGSFYDPDGYYFDREGYDEFGGHYDSENRYIPGEEN